jgi:SET domain-containing protein
MAKSTDLTVVKRSNIGLGLFATTVIPKETKIIQYTGERILSNDVQKHRGKYLFTLNQKYTIDGRSRDNLARYINHSCRPNAYTEVIRGKIWIIAKRRIRESEEITYDYGKEYFNQFIKPKGCQCAKCNSSRVTRPSV